MGHGALFVKYDKPNYKLHFAILVAIIATSVVLSLQVSKKKQATDIVAMKEPVPIDSVASRTELSASVNETQISEAALIPMVSETPSSFIAQIESQSTTLASVNSVAASDSNSTIAELNDANNQSEIVSQPDQDSPMFSNLANESQDTEPNNKDLPETTATAKVVEKTETDIAVTSASEEERLNEVSENDVIEQVGNKPQRKIVADTVVNVDGNSDENNIQVSMNNDDKAKVEKLKNSNTISLDDVYHKQQQNFLNTLARSVEKDNTADNSVKKIRDAIKNDKPIETATDAVESRVKVKQKVASLDKNKLGISNSEKKNRLLSRITRGELNNVLSQFTYYYNSGDIKRLMNLFNDQATTNGQSSKQGIKNDYADLFSTTQARRLMLKNIKWNLDSARASGAADFEVVIQSKNGEQRSSLKGVLSISAVKGADGIFITRLFHEVH